MKRILFVDDESNVLDGIRRMLRADRTHWDMHFAAGGEAALRVCETQAFDVVVSDLRMPGMDGATLLGHIRDRYPGTARLILFGYAEAALATRSVSVAHSFLAKPCGALKLQSTIERVCAQQDILCIPEVRRIVGTVGELPSLSSTYIHIRQAVSDPSTSISLVGDIIQQDVAMSAKVLQLSNSAFFGVAQKVTSLSSAASCLGMETIKDLALASEAFRVFAPASHVPRSGEIDPRVGGATGLRDCGRFDLFRRSAVPAVRLAPVHPFISLVDELFGGLAGVGECAANRYRQGYGSAVAAGERRLPHQGNTSLCQLFQKFLVHVADNG